MKEGEAPLPRRRQIAAGPGPESLGLVLLASLLFLGAVGCGDNGDYTGGRLEPAVPAPAALEGRVFDARLGAGLAGALVRLERGAQALEVSSGFDGRYRFGAVPPGDYALTATRGTHEVLRRGLSFLPRITQQMDLGLTPLARTGAAEVRVVDAAGGAPLAGVAIEVPDLARRGLSDAAGRALFPDLPAGVVRFRLLAPGFRETSAAVAIEPGGLAQPVVPMVGDSGSVRGTVTSTPPFAPLAGALVSVLGTSIATVTDAAGGYFLPAVPGDGVVDLLFSEPSHAAMTRSTGVALGRETRLDVTLPRGFGTVRGVVRGAAARPLVGATVSVPEHLLTTFTDGAGRYDFPRVPVDATLSVGAFAAGHLATGALVSLAPEQVLTVDLDLISAVGTLEGTVRRAVGGTPVAAALVSLPALLRATATDAAGFYRFFEVPAEFQRLEVTATGLTPLTTFTFVVAGATTVENLALEDSVAPPGTATLDGQILNDQTGAGVPFGVVTLPTLSRSAVTNSTGAFRFTEVALEAALPITVQATGFELLTTTTAVVDGVNNAVLRLTPR